MISQVYLQQINDLKSEIKRQSKVIERLESKLKEVKDNSKNCLCGLKFYQSSNNNGETPKNSDRQTRRIKEHIEAILVNLDDKIEMKGLRLHKVEIIDSEFVNKDLKNPFTLTFKDKPDVENLTRDVLYFKDRHCLSDNVYRALVNEFSLPLPSLHYIRELRKNLNSKFKLVHTIPNSSFISAKFRIETQVKAFLKNLGEDYIHFNGPIKVKLSADGTNVGRNHKMVNFTFTILNETNKAKTSSGNYTLGIANLEETYDDMIGPFNFITSTIKELDHITWQNRDISILYFFCSDWKLSATVFGLYAASSNNPCIWCTANKNDFHDMNMKFSITDPELFCRSKDQHENILNRKIKNHLGYKNPSLIPQFDYNKCVVDTLHMFLRISDVLIGLLVKEICGHDNVCQNTKIDISKHEYIAKFYDIISSRCKIRVNLYSNVVNGNSVIRDLTGPEKLKLFQKIKIAEDFKDIKKSELIDKLWKDFISIYTDILTNSITPSSTENKTKQWMELFQRIYIKNHITPYIHVFVSHLHQFQRLYGDINMFNLQGN